MTMVRCLRCGGVVSESAGCAICGKSYLSTTFVSSTRARAALPSVFELAREVASELREANRSSTILANDRVPRGWHLWSHRWRVEPHAPGRTSVDDGYKLGSTLMLFLRPDGSLGYVDYEERWDSGVITYPHRQQIREPGWDYLDGSASELASDNDVKRLWDFLRSKQGAKSPIRNEYGITYIYPFPISGFRDGEHLIRESLERVRKSRSSPPRHRDGKLLSTPKNFTTSSEAKRRATVATIVTATWLLVVAIFAVAQFSNAAYSPDSGIDKSFWVTTFSIVAVFGYALLWWPAYAVTHGLLVLTARYKSE